ncbi:hypothetical protein O3M35_003101 [Rhynocoris fuscipes]|uniref:Uncharacterized protein n=1 Tax=Rhynocoris fuscipes TaxID=488301 RepID=A0AAW1CIY9_9HEMI
MMALEDEGLMTMLKTCSNPEEETTSYCQQLGILQRYNIWIPTIRIGRPKTLRKYKH